MLTQVNLNCKPTCLHVECGIICGLWNAHKLKHFIFWFLVNRTIFSNFWIEKDEGSFLITYLPKWCGIEYYIVLKCLFEVLHSNCNPVFSCSFHSFLQISQNYTLLIVSTHRWPTFLLATQDVVSLVILGAAVFLISTR